jgi:hypothetical protein
MKSYQMYTLEMILKDDLILSAAIQSKKQKDHILKQNIRS